jgi:hypothetical protein
VKVELRPGVADLLWRMGEQALTVELTLDFEGDVFKQAVVFPGAGEPSLGFQRVRVGEVDVWWRQRFAFATREPQVTQAVRPHRLVVSRVGRALSAAASYAHESQREKR